jgi:hypothetical protein
MPRASRLLVEWVGTRMKSRLQVWTGAACWVCARMARGRKPSPRPTYSAHRYMGTAVRLGVARARYTMARRP